MGSAPNIPDFDQLNKEAKTFHRILSEEKNDLACILLTLAFLDRCLAAILSKFLTDGSTSKELLRHDGVIGPFHARTKLCYALGLIPKGVFRMLNKLSSLRNNLAHSHEPLTFDDQDVIAICNELEMPPVSGIVLGEDGSRKELKSWPPHLISSPRQRFMLVSVMIGQNLMGLLYTTDKRHKQSADWVPITFVPPNGN